MNASALERRLVTLEDQSHGSRTAGMANAEVAALLWSLSASWQADYASRMSDEELNARIAGLKAEGVE